MLPTLLSKRRSSINEYNNTPSPIKLDINVCQCILLNEKYRFKIDNYLPKQGVDCPCCQCKVNMGFIDIEQYTKLCNNNAIVPKARRTVKLNNFYKSQDSISETEIVQDDKSYNCIIT